MFASSKKKISVIITEQSIKAVQSASSGAVEKIARKTISTENAGQLSKALKELLTGFSVKGAEVALLIPAGSVTTKNIEIPSQDPEEIKSIVNLQVTRHTPLSREEILVGFLNLGVYQTNHSKALLVIANRNTVKEKLTILEQADLKTDKVLFVPETIASFYAKALNYKKDSLPVGIIDVGYDATHFIIMARQKTLACRSIPLGLKDLISPEDATKFVSEISNSLDTYRNDDIDKLPENFLLTSENVSVKALQVPLQDALKTAVKISSYLSYSRMNSTLLKKYQKDLSEDSFLDVLSPIFLASTAEINLLPEEIQLKRAIDQEGKEAVKAAVFALLLLILVGAVLISKIYFQDAFLNKNLRAQFAGQRGEVKLLEDRMMKNRVVREFIESRLTSIEALKELFRIIPTEMYLQSYSLSDDGTISIQGISDSAKGGAEAMSKVFSIVSDLEQSPLFKAVEIKSNVSKKDRGKDVAAFEITFKLESAEDEKEPVAQKKKE